MNALLAFFSALLGSCIAIAGTVISNRSENRRQYRKDLQNLYMNCIRNLSLVLTLARDENDRDRLDKIETSLAESKAFLVLLLAHEKELPKLQEVNFEQEVKSFVLGQYDKVIEVAESHNLFPQERFKNYINYRYMPASDVILQRLIEVSSLDKKLKSP